MTCPACMKPIDEAFDATAKDERGRTIHTSCLIERAGGPADAFHDPDFDIAVFGAWGLLGRKIKRGRDNRRVARR